VYEESRTKTAFQSEDRVEELEAKLRDMERQNGGLLEKVTGCFNERLPCNRAIVITGRPMKFNSCILTMADCITYRYKDE